MKKIIGSVIAIVFLFSPILSKDKKISFDEKSALHFIKVLASDEMEGRNSGQPGARRASAYIAEKFQEWGLEPAGDDGSYFQNFTIEHSYQGPYAYLEIITDSGKREFSYLDDWRIMNYSGSGHFMAEIIFAGYGIHAPEKEYSDYDGLDIKGKIVMISTALPRGRAASLGEAVHLKNRIKAVQDLGARGIIGCDLNTRESKFVFLHMTKELYKPDFVVFTIMNDVTKYIFRDLKAEPRYITQELPKGESLSFATGVKAVVSVGAFFDPERPTRNVLGKITGRDKKLRGETIVIGAHMDHTGVMPQGLVYNGADDNASGTALAMEIARVMKMNGYRPRRTILFGLWAGEEQGLLGSQYYVDHPAMPLDTTVVNLNMDMVGHGKGDISFHGIYYGPEIWKMLREELPEEIFESIKPGRGGPGGSDHTPFLGAGIPGFMIQSKGQHLKYHTSRDDTDLIAPEALKGMGDFMMAAVEIIADSSQSLIPPLRLENYHLKYQTLINHRRVALSHALANFSQKTDPIVDAQMTIIPVDESLDRRDMKIDLLDKLFSVEEKLKKAKNLVPYQHPFNSFMFSRQAKTLALIGIEGVKVFQDDPRWAQVIAALGVNFVYSDDLSFLFDDNGLTEEGIRFMDELSRSGLLLWAAGLSDSQATALLKKARKPVILNMDHIPADEVMEAIMKKRAALGLILKRNESAADYAAKLDKAVKKASDQHVMIVNEECLWEEEAQQYLIQLFSELIKKDYMKAEMHSSSMLSNILSGTFFRVLREVQPASSQPRSDRMPF